jgi:arylsulfatase A-like enzyme
MRHLVAVLVAVFSIAESRAESRPNVVFILADDLGRHDCGFMGGTEIKTPHLDKLAAGGTKLDAFYVQPVCSPTRAALMTGRYPMRHGLQVGVVRPWAQYGLPLEERTLAQALKEAGYRTAVVGKWHLGHFSPEYLPTRRGFDRQYGHYNGALDYFTHVRDGGFDWHRDDKVCRDEGYSTHLLAKEAVGFIRDHDVAKPFFLYLPFNAVHAPHQAPEEYLKRYANLTGERKKYAAMLTAMDDAVGAVVAEVERRGMRKDTLFVFSSDNGGPQPGVVTDNGKFRAGKGTLYDGGVRVVAFATWDGRIAPGTTTAEPIHMVDWYPTLLKLCGAKAEQKLPVDGIDVWPALAEKKPLPPRTILVNTTPNNGAVRGGDWKLIVRDGADDPDGGVPKKDGKRSVELFNLKDDPHEKTNVADANGAKVKELREQLAAFAKQAVPPKAAPKPKGFVTPKVWGEKD